MKQKALGRFLMSFYPLFVFLCALTAAAITGRESPRSSPASSYFAGPPVQLNLPRLFKVGPQSREIEHLKNS